MKISENHTYSCDKCGEVTMSLSFLEHYTKSGDRDFRVMSSFDGYGECQLAAAFGGVPTLEELKDCPVASFIMATKNAL